MREKAKKFAEEQAEKERKKVEIRDERYARKTFKI